MCRGGLTINESFLLGSVNKTIPKDGKPLLKFDLYLISEHGSQRQSEWTMLH